MWMCVIRYFSTRWYLPWQIYPLLNVSTKRGKYFPYLISENCIYCYLPWYIWWWCCTLPWLLWYVTYCDPEPFESSLHSRTLILMIDLNLAYAHLNLRLVASPSFPTNLIRVVSQMYVRIVVASCLRYRGAHLWLSITCILHRNAES